MAIYKILVELDKEATETPNVIVDDRDKEVPSGHKVKWRNKDKNNKQNPRYNFDIVRVDPCDGRSAFQNCELGNNKNNLTCDFDAGGATKNTEFPYTLYVESDGVEYDTTDPLQKDEDGKPVIRN